MLALASPVMDPEDRSLARLVEIDAITRVKYAYARCLDQKQWDEMDTLLTEDCIATYSGGKYTYEGRDAIVDFLRSAMGADSFLSSHRMHHPEIDLTGPDSAVGTWALEDVVVESQWQIVIRGAAFYTDDYVKRDGRWLIHRTGYKRTYETMEPWSATPGLQLTASWWGTDGQSTLDA